jgi:ABC-type transport system involved in cytochrome c biogenesis ATPase subunit
VIFIVMVKVSIQNAGDTEVLVMLATVLPRQIEMTKDCYTLAAGWNDMVAVWARLGGAVDNMYPDPDAAYDARIKYDRLVLREDEQAKTVGSLDDALKLVYGKRTGRINVRGGNGSGKSTMLAALKASIKNRAYYWPTTDRLAFQFAEGTELVDDDEGIDPELLAEAGEPEQHEAVKKVGFSSGERQLKSLQEIVRFTDASIYLLDEWDANLDPKNRAAANALVEKLASRARVIEISHRDAA